MFKTPLGSCESDEADKVENLIHIISLTLCLNLSRDLSKYVMVVWGENMWARIHSIIEGLGEEKEVMNGNLAHPPEKSAVQHAAL